MSRNTKSVCLSKASAVLIGCVATLLFVLSGSVVHASSVYQTAPALSSSVTSISGTFAYKIPAGITFNTVQIYSEDPLSSIFWVYTYDPLTGQIIAELQGYSGVTYSWSEVSENVYEVVLPVSHTTTANNSFFFTYPSSVGLGITSDTNAFDWDGDFDTSPNYAPALKLCNGACETDTFSPIPNLTASPWARIVSPVSSSTISVNQTFNVQYNTGTTTPDFARLLFSSGNQSIVPFDSSTLVSGLNSFSHTQSFPALEDNITAKIQLISGTSTILYESPEYVYNVSLTVSDVDQQLETCDQYNILLKGVCKVFYFLFVPSNTAVASFMEVKTQMDTRIPFVYVGQAQDMFQTLYGTTGSMPSISVPFGTWGSVELISQAKLEAIPFVDDVRLLISAGMWVLFLYGMYKMGLGVHDKQTV